MKKGIFIFLVCAFFLFLGWNNVNIIKAYEEKNVYFVDGTNGSDTNDGLSNLTAFKTIEKAINLVNQNNYQECTVVLVGSLELVTNYEMPKSLSSITIKGESATLIVNGDLFIGFKTTFENITIKNNNDGTIYLNGYQTHFKNTVNCESVTGKYLDIVGTKNDDLISDVSLTIDGGIFNSVFLNGDHLLTGNADFLFNGGEVKDIIAGTKSGNINGNTHIVIKNLYDVKLPNAEIFGGGITGEVSSNTRVELIGDFTVKNSIYGAGKEESSKVLGESSLKLDGNITVASSASCYSAGKYGYSSKAKFEAFGDINGTGIVFEASFALGSMAGNIGDKKGEEEQGEIVLKTIIDGKFTCKKTSYFASRGTQAKYSKIYGSIENVIGVQNESSFIGSTSAYYFGGGNYCDIYGNISTTYNANVVCSSLYGASGGSTSGSPRVEGNVSLVIGNNDNNNVISVNDNVYGCGRYCQVVGDVSVTLNTGCEITGKLYGGNYGSATYSSLNGKTFITLNGGKIGNVLIASGNYKTSSGDLTVTLKGGNTSRTFTNNLKSGNVYWNIELERDLNLGFSVVSKNLIAKDGILTLLEGANVSVTSQFSGKLKWDIEKDTSSEFIKLPGKQEKGAVEFVGSQTPSIIESENDTTYGFSKVIKVKFANIDFNFAEISLYNSFEASGDKIVVSNDGIVTLGVGTYCISLRNITDDLVYVEYNWTLLINGEKINKYSNGMYEVDCFNGFRTNTGWEDYDPICIYNDELRYGVRGTKSLPYFSKDMYKTPAIERFREGIYQKYTTDDEIYSFLSNMIDHKEEFPYSKYMYVYVAGYSESFEYPVYAVIFTKADLTGLSFDDAILKTKEDALKNNKVRIFHTAQTHGSEHADSDGALAFIYQLAKGNYADGKTSLFTNMDDIFNDANIIVTPRNCPDGASLVQRYNQIHQLDPNRDHIVLQNTETINLNKIYFNFLPEMVITGHELYGDNLAVDGIQRYDVSIKSGSFGSFGSELAMYADSQFIPFALEFGSKAGLNMYEYGREPSVVFETEYYAYTGAISCLIEVRGTSIGLEMYDRRVYSYLITAKGMCDKIIKDKSNFVYDKELSDSYFSLSDPSVDLYYDLTKSTGVIDMVKARRQYLINGPEKAVDQSIASGKTKYVDKVDENGYGNGGKFDYDGTIKTSKADSLQTLNFFDTFEYINLPKGYFVDAKTMNSISKTPGFDKILKDVFDYHNIKYYYFENLNESINVKQMKVTKINTFPKNIAPTHDYATKIKYIEEVEEYDLTTKFENGVYYIPLNQLSSLLVVYLLEQTTYDNLRNNSSLANNQRLAYTSSLYGAGYVDFDENNLLPIYRYYGEIDNLVYVNIYKKDNDSYIRLEDDVKVLLNGTLDLTNLYFGKEENGVISYTKLEESMLQKDFSKYGLQTVFVTCEGYSCHFNCYVVDEGIKGDVVYLSNSGSDKNDGSDHFNAVKSLYRAHQILLEKNEKGEGTIIVSGISFFSDLYRKLPKHEGLVTITSKYGDVNYLDYENVCLNITRNLGISGPTTFENIRIKNACSTASRMICGQGNILTIGENVETFSMNDYYPSIIGGFYEGNHQVEYTFLTVNSGTWRNLYGANYRGNLKGDVFVIINGGMVGNTCYGGFYEKGLLEGDICFFVNGGEFSCSVYSGTNHGDLIGNTYFFAGGGIFKNGKMGAKANDGKITGNSVVYQVNKDYDISSFVGTKKTYNEYLLYILDLNMREDIKVDVQNFDMINDLVIISKEVTLEEGEMKDYYQNLELNYNKLISSYNNFEESFKED